MKIHWPYDARKQSGQIRCLVVLLAALCLGIQALGIYYDLNWRTLIYTAHITVDPGLTVQQVGTGAKEGGFQVGDRLVRIGKQKIGTILDYRKALNRQKPDSWVTVTIQRGDQTMALPVQVKTKPLDLPTVARNVIAFAFLAMGLLAAFQRPADKAARLFFLTAFVLALYFALQQTEMTGLVVVQVVALTLASALAIHFFLTFPEERWLAKSRWWFLLYLPSLVLMGLTLHAFVQSLQAGIGIFYPGRFHTLTTVDLAYLVLSAILGLGSLAHAYVTTPRSILKRQLQWIMWGLACAILSSICDISLTLMGLQTYQTYSLLLLGVLPLPVAFAFAILRYRLLDIDLVVNRSVVYGLLTGILAALYLLLISQLSRALGLAAGSESYTIVVFLSALLIGALVNPLRARIQTLIDQYFFRHQLDYQRALSHWSQELNTSLRFSDLTELLAHRVPEQLMIDAAWLLVLNQDETRLVPLPAKGGQADAQLAISAHDATNAELVRPGRALLLNSRHEEGRLVTVGDIPPAWIQAGIRVVLPLVVSGKLTGLYLLGHKLSGDIYQRQELDLLQTLANQAAIAITNARLYEEIHAFSQELEEKVAERTQELRDFMSVVYHELSTPITAIHGYAKLLLDRQAGPLNDRQMRFLGTISRSVQRLMSLVGDLSDVSKIDAGRLTVHPEPLDLNQSVEETLQSLSTMIEEKGLRVDISLAPEAAVVQGDPQRVAQILTNLISNACRYTPAGGQITILSSRVDGAAEVTVRDTGIGISRNDLNRIFERFYRSDEPLVREQPGTGLGLAITKSLVELHGGRLWVKSRVGEGSTFGFTLPLAGQDKPI